MRRLLIAMVLLSTVMSDESLTKDRQEASSRVLEKQFWSKRGKRIPRDIARLDAEDFSGSRVFAKPVKLSPLTILRYVDNNARHSQYDSTSQASSDDLECRAVYPTILFSIDFRHLFDEDEESPSSCVSGNCLRRREGWELQKPLYVEEPSWIEIKNDYADSPPHHISSIDPFIHTRGKKFQTVENTVTIAQEQWPTDYEDYLDPRDNIKTPTSNVLLRSRRSMRLDKLGKRNDATSSDLTKNIEEREVPESAKEKTYISDLEKYEDPFFLTRGKKVYAQKDKYSIRRNLETFMDDREKPEIYTTKKLRRGKRSLPTFEAGEDDDQTNVNTPAQEELKETNSTNTNEKLTIGARIDDGVENRTDDLDDDVQSSYTQLKRDLLKGLKTTGRNEKSPSLFHSRTRRNSYNDLYFSDGSKVEKDATLNEPADGYNLWDKNVYKILTGKNDLERRGKKSDILDIFEQPYFISRGKKRDDRLNYGVSPRDEERYERLIGTLAAREILNRMADSLNCVSEECREKFKQVVKKSTARGRRGILDELLTKYDPFYVARGKRPYQGDSLLKSSNKVND